jgi:hypothetical protein
MDEPLKVLHVFGKCFRDLGPYFRKLLFRPQAQPIELVRRFIVRFHRHTSLSCTVLYP